MSSLCTDKFGMEGGQVAEHVRLPVLRRCCLVFGGVVCAPRHDCTVCVCLARPIKADGMQHEGAIPKSATRMLAAFITLSVGHGLRGLLPSIPGTLLTLRLSENGLEGRLPELHITAKSTLLVHANGLSCQLPRLRGLLPSTPGTLSAPSLSVDGLEPPEDLTDLSDLDLSEVDLPEPDLLDIFQKDFDKSTLFDNSKHLSCQLPRHGE
eukprot:2031609-Amphidinium_carterae.1